MPPQLQGIEIAILGGDAREVVLAEHLADLGARLRVAGIPVQGINVDACGDLKAAVSGARAVILALPGINESGRLHAPLAQQPLFLTADVLAELTPANPVLVGMARPALKEMISGQGLRLIEILNLDEVAILNSIPSAEGAIQMAMEAMPITIHGCRALVAGFGRTGMTLARMLGALNADTLVAARKASDLARITEMGLLPVPLQELSACLKDVDVVFNTVPAVILDEMVLSRLNPGALIIDLASAPGGTDFKAAEKMGLKAVLAPGLPGKVAPKTAGRILARVVPDLLVKELGL
ncbi:MAG: dipicolinate synthase subunit DpsA [Bacillota bacterium]|jgi:dipicolinate synthase subunit A